MRLIGKHKEQEPLRRFVAYLQSHGIGAEMRPYERAWGLWVHHEDAFPRAKAEFVKFQRNPAADRYQAELPGAASTAAEGSLPRTRSRDPESKPQVGWRSLLWRPDFLQGPTPVTKVLMAVSIIVTLPILLRMPLGNLLIHGLRTDDRWTTQWWRLLTPAFLHFNLLHIVFNMLWLSELGSRIERIKGPGFMALFFVVCAAISNYAQWIAGGGHPFGGMSGVVYGLFGYIWIKSRIAPSQGFSIDPGTVMMLMLWFFLGWTGIMPIANWAHGFGLGSGIALAVAPELRRRPTPDPLDD